MDATKRHECDLLRQLRCWPRIFDEIDAAGETELQRQKRLRQSYPVELVQAALTLADLRRKAASKFSRASGMWLLRQELEQATSETIARHKARRFDGLVWDYCAGIGGDALALAARGEVVAVDRDPCCCLCVQWNAELYEVAGTLQAVCADVGTMTDRSSLLHIDPDRRSSPAALRHPRKRTLRIEEASPGLDVLRQLIEEFAGGAIKLSPASNFADKFPGAEIELISERGECKEATVWFGRLASPGTWRATVLPAAASLSGDPLQAAGNYGALDRYVYDPDPAVVRAGLVDLLSERESLTRLDREEEFLSADRLIDTPFARAFEVAADLPNNDRAIRRYFRESDIGTVEIKCRHIPIDAEAVRRRLPLDGSQQSVLIFARIGGKARALVCRRMEQKSDRGEEAADPASP